MERRPPIRLSSPRLFRDIFSPDESDPSTRTAQEVNRALHTANRALQSAQEALQSGQTPAANTPHSQDVVDLTYSPPQPVSGPASNSDDAYDAFLSRFIHPHDPVLTTSRGSNSMNLLNEPLYGPQPSGGQDYIEEQDPTAIFTGPDSLAGPLRRFENQRRNFLGLPGLDRFSMRPSQTAEERRHDEDAVRRQRIARQQWDESQRRQAERRRLERQRQQILSRTSTSPQASRAVPPSQFCGASRQSDVTSTSPVEAVDLTNVDDHPSLAAALSKQRMEAVQSQNAATANFNHDSPSGPPRSAFSGYKCPICMEQLENATTTVCGHLFCHKCIIDALKGSEKTRTEEDPGGRKKKGVCPVCRKELHRRDEAGNGRTLVPLEVKFVSRFELKRKREQEEEEIRKRRAEKGKGKAEELSDPEDGDVEDVTNEYKALHSGEWDGDKENIQREAKRPRFGLREGSLDDSLFEFKDEEFDIDVDTDVDFG